MSLLGPPQFCYGTSLVSVCKIALYGTVTMGFMYRQYMCGARFARRAVRETHMFFTIQNWRHLSEQRLVFFSSGIWFVAFCLNFCFISTRILVQVCVANCIDIHPRGLRMHASQCPSLCCTNKPPATAVPYVFMFPVMFPLNISAVVH